MEVDAEKVDRGRTYQTYPVKIQVCLDTWVYNKIQNLMIDAKENNISKVIRVLLHERFKLFEQMEQEQIKAVHQLNNVIQRYDSQLNEKTTKLVDLEKKYKQIEKKLKLLEAKKK